MKNEELYKKHRREVKETRLKRVLAGDRIRSLARAAGSADLDERSREQAAERLLDLGDRGRKKVRRLIRQVSNLSSKSAAITAVGARRDTSFLDDIRPLAHVKNEAIRSTARRALRNLGEETKELDASQRRKMQRSNRVGIVLGVILAVIIIGAAIALFIIGANFLASLF